MVIQILLSNIPALNVFQFKACHLSFIMDSWLCLHLDAFFLSHGSTAWGGHGDMVVVSARIVPFPICTIRE
jgi:hypothetical protein